VSYPKWPNSSCTYVLSFWISVGSPVSNIHITGNLIRICLHGICICFFLYSSNTSASLHSKSHLHHRTTDILCICMQVCYHTVLVLRTCQFRL
jgi:hypothetical protein